MPHITPLPLPHSLKFYEGKSLHGDEGLNAREEQDLISYIKYLNDEIKEKDKLIEILKKPYGRELCYEMRDEQERTMGDNQST